ncbi:MAG: hypothetical protein ACKV2V_08555, partial [Blastocatellia bacterium]
KRETWVLQGFIPADKTEETTLDSLRRDLGFCPCEQAERLRYSSATARPERDPKRILGQLTNEKFEREQSCWTDTELGVLRKRGEETFLKHFLDEVREYLLPLL